MHDLDRLISEPVGFDDTCAGDSVRTKLPMDTTVHTMVAYHLDNETTFWIIGFVLNRNFTPFDGCITLFVVGQSTFKDRKKRLSKSEGQIHIQNASAEDLLCYKVGR